MVGRESYVDVTDPGGPRQDNVTKLTRGTVKLCQATKDRRLADCHQGVPARR